MKSLIAIKDAFFYSMSGLRYLFKERAYKQEHVVLAILCIVEICRNTSVYMRLYLFSSFVLILFAEAVNSAIEAVVDRVGLERHELSKKAKDIASAAVFITMVHFAIVWIISFIL